MALSNISSSISRFFSPIREDSKLKRGITITLLVVFILATTLIVPGVMGIAGYFAPQTFMAHITQAITLKGSITLTVVGGLAGGGVLLLFVILAIKNLRHRHCHSEDSSIGPTIFISIPNGFRVSNSITGSEISSSEEEVPLVLPVAQPTYYSFDVSDDSCFFKAVNIFASRYDPARNYVQFYPNNNDVEANSVFAETIFEDLNPQIATYRDPSKPLDLSKKPQDQYIFVREIDVAGSNVRTAIDRLFQQHHIGVILRSAIEQPIKELEKCLEYNTKLSADISSAQTSIIEAFVEPYIGILKEKMEFWQIEASLEKACIILKGYVDPSDSFLPIMRDGFINRYPCQATSSTHPNIPIINKEWEIETQNQVLESLYMIATILTGKSNLEGALLQSGTHLPNLETQKRVVLELLST